MPLLWGSPLLTRAAKAIIPRKLKQALKSRVLGLPRHDSASPLRIAEHGPFKVAYRAGTADESVIGHSFEHDLFFAGVPEYQPRPSDVVLDVGAHIGTFSLLAASKVREVHAIEASEDSFNYLRVNAALNNASNLVIHHLALSDHEGTCTLFHDRGNWGHSMVAKLSDRTETVPCCSLQQFWERNQLGKIDFAKFNCEGAEFPILLSASLDLLRNIASMLVLYHCDLWTANPVDDLVAKLQAAGFDCVIREQTELRGGIIATRSRA